jgi:D-glycero-alpha-D-manno-heptose 1-phosphate guanylyltransferase
MEYEAIILCGGEGWRLKPATWTPKPLLKISADETLVDRQIRWLLEHDFSNIVLASDRTFPESTYFNSPVVQTSLEKRRLGTGGAIKQAAKLISADQFYAMNVDDIVFYDPRKLYKYANRGAAILLAQPRLLFGKITTRREKVIKFEDRPLLGVWVSAGHYIFSKKLVEEHFPDEGNFERKAMQEIVNNEFLKGLKYMDDWLTVNTLKDLMTVREHFETRQTKPK